MDVNWNPATQFKVPIPRNEKQRLVDLRQYQILDTPPEENFDTIALLASHICQTPIALVSLIDSDRQWFKSKVGLTVSETSRDAALCAHAIMQRDLFVIRDAASDKRFARNPLVMSSPKIRFYAGAPLVTSDNHALGTLCVIDRVPRVLNKAQLEALRALSQLVMAHLEQRRKAMGLKQALRGFRRAEMNLLQTSQALRAANDAKAEMLLRLSHEVRTTMHGILQLTEPLLGLRLPSKGRRQLQILKSSATALYTFANEIVNYSRVERCQADARKAAESPKVAWPR
jgi:GAF domain-containing protein